MEESSYHDLIVKFYDFFVKDREIDILFYKNYYFKQKNKKILELTCGTGRILIPILQEGITIHGLDLSKEMLDKLKEKLKNRNLHTKIIHGDMTDFKINEKYDSIFIPYGGFMFLDSQKAELALDNIKKHLSINGEIIMDLYIPWNNILSKNSNTFNKIGDFVNTFNERCIIWEKFSINLIAHLKAGEYKLEYYKNGILCKVQIKKINSRWYTEEDMKKLLCKAGYKSIEILTDNPLYKNGYSYVIRAYV